MNLTITRQRNLMQQAIGYYQDIKCLENNFRSDNTLVEHKIQLLHKAYAETVTELAKLLMEGALPICRDGGIGGISFPKTDRP